MTPLTANTSKPSPYEPPSSSQVALLALRCATLCLIYLLLGIATLGYSADLASKGISEEWARFNKETSPPNSYPVPFQNPKAVLCQTNALATLVLHLFPNEEFDLEPMKKAKEAFQKQESALLVDLRQKLNILHQENNGQEDCVTLLEELVKKEPSLLESCFMHFQEEAVAGRPPHKFDSPILRATFPHPIPKEPTLEGLIQHGLAHSNQTLVPKEDQGESLPQTCFVHVQGLHDPKGNQISHCLKGDIRKIQLEQKHYRLKGFVVRSASNRSAGHYYTCLRHVSPSGKISYLKINDLDSKTRVISKEAFYELARKQGHIFGYQQTKT